ncbi:MAG: hypothetical protein AAB945_00410 [Patescibacteria group bacterium]
MIKNYYFKGISLIEILVIFAGLGLLVAIVMPQFYNIRKNQVLKSAVGDVLSTVNKARSRTLASMNSSTYGVHFQSDKVIIFKGTVFSALDVNNETINIFSPASITNVTFGGVSDVVGDLYFNRIYGTPSTTGTVTISTGSSSKILTINQSGNISSN